MVCSVRYVPNYTSDICSVYTLQNVTIHYGRKTVPTSPGRLGTCLIYLYLYPNHQNVRCDSIPDTGIPSTAVKELRVRARYGLSTMSKTQVWLGTNSISVPSTYVSSVRLRYGCPTHRQVRFAHSNIYRLLVPSTTTSGVPEICVRYGLDTGVSGIHGVIHASYDVITSQLWLSSGEGALLHEFQHAELPTQQLQQHFLASGCRIHAAHESQTRQIFRLPQHHKCREHAHPKG